MSTDESANPGVTGAAPTVERVDVETVTWDVWAWVVQTGNMPPMLLGSYTSRDAALTAQPPYGDRMALLKVRIPAGWLRGR